MMRLLKKPGLLGRVRDIKERAECYVERRKPYFPAVFPPIKGIHNILVLMGSTRHNGAEQTDESKGIKGGGHDGAASA